jgi:hypothetical protein
MQKGSIIIPLLILVAIAFGVLLSTNTLYNKSAVPDQNQTYAGTCCDTGDGDSCHVQTGSGQTLTYNGSQYGLIKSDITMAEGTSHLATTGQSFNGNPIIRNTSDSTAASYECAHNQGDQVYGKNPDGSMCVEIPNDEIMYVCTKNCGSIGSTGTYNPNQSTQNTPEFDAYFRLSDIPTPGIPDVVKNCDKSSLTSKVTGQKIIEQTDTKKTDQQLGTFKVVNKTSTDWLSPYCKPAIYLYPTATMPVNVKINPVGPIKLTIPQYPATGGWNVIANPTGQILDQGKSYDYLYYEAEIPDDKISVPTNGYVTKQEDMKKLLTTLLPKLGLNPIEKTQFIDYWTKALPNANYYFVGIVPVSNLDSISPLTISPKPTTTIRVTLYFKPMEKPIEVNPPNLSKITRNGFTAVEWGGIFKKTKGYPFSCFQ